MKLELYSFHDGDRSSKVRWTAALLGVTVQEHRVEPGAHRRPPYTDLNPYGQIPTAKLQGQVLVESSAICHALCDAVNAPRLRVEPGEPGRQQYLYWMSIFSETLEGPLVQCVLSTLGILGPEYLELHRADITRKVAVVARQLPAQGWLAGERFTLADVFARYSLQLALRAKLTQDLGVQAYLGRNRAYMEPPEPPAAAPPAAPPAKTLASPVPAKVASPTPVSVPPHRATAPREAAPSAFQAYYCFFDQQDPVPQDAPLSADRLTLVTELLPRLGRSGSYLGLVAQSGLTLKILYQDRSYRLELPQAEPKGTLATVMGYNALVQLLAKLPMDFCLADLGELGFEP